jgi:hypothetical protein
MKLFKKIIFSIIGIAAIAAGFGFYLFNKPHQSIENTTAAASTFANNLVAEFEANENTANQKYLGKIVEVKGIISDQSTDEHGVVNVVLQGGDLAGVGCQFEKTVKLTDLSLQKGQQIIVKGICTGMLMDVVLVDCVLVNNKTS